MASVFWVQLGALVWKNWVVLWKNPFSTLLRCLILPIAYGFFIGYAQVFLHRLNNYGLGTPTPITSLGSQFSGKTALMWVDATDGSSSPSPTSIMAHITANFTADQLAAVKKLSNASDIPAQCPQNFNGFSSCFAGIAFNNLPPVGNTFTPINYTIYADAGLNFIDVEDHTSSFETRIFPLQWSIDKAIIELQTGIPQITPLEWLYTNMTNTEQKLNIRLSYVRGIRNLICLALFITFVGVSYQIPGSVASDRAMLITEHMKAMGLLDSARILSWHLGISSTYLPAWIGVSLTWRYLIFTETNTGLIVGLHLLLGFVLASWSFVIAVPFNNSPQLAAVVATFLAIVLAIVGLVLQTSNTAVLFVFSVVFPPSFYIFALKAICGWENNQLGADVLQGDPDSGIMLLPLLVAAAVAIFLWPVVAVALEQSIYEAVGPRSARTSPSPYLLEKGGDPVSADTAVSTRNLTKIYKSSPFGSKKKVSAIIDLNLDIPKTGIFVMLGSNGAGKSTALSILGGLQRLTTGTVIFDGGYSRPPRGTIGIVPQKNALFPHLTCLQTLHVWKAIKWSNNSATNEDLEQLLRDCDLEQQIHANAATLSGGQKRKLHLAIGLLGGSKIILVDECTSGVDPLSRRALWKILTVFREDRCIILTTHFLDEADLLGDHIVILAPPGKVVASGSPVALKRNLGEGYTIQVSFNAGDQDKIDSYSTNEILPYIKTFAPQTYCSTPSPFRICYHLKTRDGDVVGQILEFIDVEIAKGRVVSYDILGTTIEDIFLDLMSDNAVVEKATSDTCTPSILKSDTMDLPSGIHVSCFGQAFTIFRKRLLIAKRSWLGPLLTIVTAVAGACIPLFFILGKQQLCVQPLAASNSSALWLPVSPVTFQGGNRTLVSPLGFVETVLAGSLDGIVLEDFPDNATFVNEITQNYHNIGLGGVSFDTETGASLVAWEGTPPGLRGAAMLNLATNVLYNRALNNSGSATQQPAIIHSNYSTFPRVTAATLVYLRWMFFFGAVMAVYPAFYALYVSKERTSSVQAMQFSNGLANPMGLWLGHLMFDTISSVALSTIIIIIFATVSDQFYGLGYLWLVLVLYGVSSTLFAYCLSLMVSSPLAAFAIVAGYQFVMFVLYLSSYLFILTFGPVTESSRLINIVHFSISVVAPVASITRAALVSTNIFSLACDGKNITTGLAFGSVKKYGGPILYLIVYSLVLLLILFWIDGGSRRLWCRSFKTGLAGKVSPSSPEKMCEISVDATEDLLRVLNISKKFNGKQAMEDVNFNIPRNTIFALLGPNGAGKTTTFNIIRGSILPDNGDVFINGHSIVTEPRTARSYLGVCPQFTAIDIQLTVREHMMVYARLKGLRGLEMKQSIDAVLEGTSLSVYADRMASKLSGGNQRKLSLAIALLGNPLVILIDEFSTGVDPKMKREMWDVLRKVAVGKAIVITTHSMEEASAIANRVGILSKHMLAMGTTESLSSRYHAYEVHFSCRTREQAIKARSLMALVPGSCIVEDATTRFEVPITESGPASLAELFKTLSTHGDFMEYTVERPSLESIFLKVVRENDVTGRKHDKNGSIHSSESMC